MPRRCDCIILVPRKCPKLTSKTFERESRKNAGVRVSVAGVDYGFACSEDLLNSYIDGPVAVTAYAANTTGWFSYEIKKISLGEE